MKNRFEKLIDVIDGRIVSLKRRINDHREPREVKIILQIRLEECEQLQGIYKNY